MSHEKTDTVKMTTLIFAMVASVIATVFILEWKGKIKHSENKSQYSLSEYKVVLIPEINQGEDTQSYRLSQKPSHQTAFCHQGYLFIGSDDNEKMQGLLVDYKNRGVKCAPEPQTTTPKQAHKPNAEKIPEPQQ